MIWRNVKQFFILFVQLYESQIFSQVYSSLYIPLKYFIFKKIEPEIFTFKTLDQIEIYNSISNK